MGTVTKDIESAINISKQGQITYKTEKQGIIHALIGKSSFNDQQLIDNIIP